MAAEETYVAITDVDTFADDNGFPNWRTLPQSKKQRALYEATKDIERYHQQIELDDSLWQKDEPEMQTAAKIQSIFVAEHIELRQTADRVRHLGSGYSDGNLSVSEPGVRELHPDAKLHIDRFMLRVGIRQNALFRA